MKKHGKTPLAVRFAIVDLLAVFGYIGVMIPMWTLELDEYRDGRFGLLVGYVTAPMIVNM